ncbi:MAG: hypothetical protein V1725_03155 [archaeon]
MQRQTAKLCNIKDIFQGNYVKKEGWESNYVESSRGNLNRVQFVAAIVSKDDQGIWLDDGTEKIQGRTFEGDFSAVSVGDIVLVVAKIRAYAETRYLAVEIIHPTSAAWSVYQRKVLELFPVRKVEQHNVQLITEKPKQSLHDAALAFIKEQDKGDGVHVDAISEHVGSTTTVLEELFKQGEIFEIRPGFVKRLDL